MNSIAETVLEETSVMKMNVSKLKVLIAEDNEVNRLLAKGILSHWGAESKIAENGLQVMELLKSEDFDLVLMDIQMPEKSGIEAAYEIRQMEDLKKKNIPIIALTANALKGEETKYKNAGMNDFLTKPFKEAELYEVIERVLNKEGNFEASSHSENHKEMGKQEENKLYDFVQLEELAAGNEEFIVALANIFLETIPQTSTELVEATVNGDWVSVSKLAHKLKSTIDTMNINTIKTDIRTLEFDAKNKVNKELLYVLAVKVDNIIQKVAAQVKQEFNL